MNPVVLLGEQAFRLFPGSVAPVLQVAKVLARPIGVTLEVPDPSDRAFLWADVSPFDYDEHCYFALAALCAMRALVEASKAQDEANAAARERQLA